MRGAKLAARLVEDRFGEGLGLVALVALRGRLGAAPADGVDAAIALLPEPLLTVAASLAPSSPAGQLVRQMALGVGAPPVLTPLDDIRAYSNIDRGETPTADTADITSDQTF